MKRRQSMNEFWRDFKQQDLFPGRVTRGRRQLLGDWEATIERKPNQQHDGR